MDFENVWITTKVRAMQARTKVLTLVRLFGLGLVVWGGWVVLSNAAVLNFYGLGQSVSKGTYLMGVTAIFAGIVIVGWLSR